MSAGVVSILHKSLEEAQKSLTSTNDAIKKLTGRDPTLPSRRPGPGSQRRYSSSGGGGGGGGRMRAWSDDNVPPSKRQDTIGSSARFAGRLGPPPKREDSDGEDNPDIDGHSGKPSLQSSIVAAAVPPRPEADPNEDRKSKTRNRRMFGVLMGTLQKFKEESSKNTEKERRRAEIEEKLDQAATREKEEAAMERKGLFEQRRAQRTQINRLASHVEVAEMYDEWNTHDHNLIGYIKTTAKPPIFYLPAKTNDNIDGLVAKTKEAIEAVIQDRQKQIDEVVSETNVSLKVKESEEEPVTEQVVVKKVEKTESGEEEVSSRRRRRSGSGGVGSSDEDD